MDDVLLMAREDHMIDHRNILLLTPQRLGWQINWEKSELTPTHSINYIGYRLLTNEAGGYPVLKIPAERIRKLRKDIRWVLGVGHASARCLARIAGQCISMAKAVLIAKLLLRNIYHLLRQKESWENILMFNTSTVQDLEWWLMALGEWNGRSISACPVEIQIETDASQTGWGSHMTHNGKKASGFWDMAMAVAPSNNRELMAVI
jgi:hypothetical protein